MLVGLITLALSACASVSSVTLIDDEPVPAYPSRYTVISVTSFAANRSPHPYRHYNTPGRVHFDFVIDSDEQLLLDAAGRVFGLIYYPMEGKLVWGLKGFLWTASEGMVEYHTRLIEPADINSSGQVAGGGWIDHNGKREFHALLWDSDLGITDLGAGGRLSRAHSLNDHGQVVGSAETANGQFHASFWDAGLMIDLGALGGDSSSARAINNTGQVVGLISSKVEVGEWLDKAFLWTRGGGMVELGSLGGNESRAGAINDKNDVVGTSKTVQGHNRAFIWRHDSGMVDLGTLGGRDSSANAINNVGQVVGWSDITWSDTQQRRAFLWDHGKMIDLSALPEVREAGWSELTEAMDINDKGQIVGFGLREGKVHVFLLTPAPPLANGG